MNIKMEIVKENEDGSAIALLELDKDAISYLCGEGMLTIIKRGLASSESYVDPEKYGEVKSLKEDKPRRKKNVEL
jgi:hypothetical protein